MIYKVKKKELPYGSLKAGELGTQEVIMTTFSFSAFLNRDFAILSNFIATDCTDDELYNAVSRHSEFTSDEVNALFNSKDMDLGFEVLIASQKACAEDIRDANKYNLG